MSDWTPEREALLRDLEAEATQEPWFVTVMPYDAPVRQTVVGGVHQDEVALCCDPRKNTEADATFIATVRNDLPDLLTALTDERARREAAERTLTQLRHELQVPTDLLARTAQETRHHAAKMETERDEARAALAVLRTVGRDVLPNFDPFAHEKNMVPLIHLGIAWGRLRDALSAAAPIAGRYRASVLREAKRICDDRGATAQDADDLVGWQACTGCGHAIEALADAAEKGEAMSDALDLDVIETAAYGHGFVSALDVIALVAEVRRLRAEVEAAEVRKAYDSETVVGHAVAWRQTPKYTRGRAAQHGRFMRALDAYIAKHAISRAARGVSAPGLRDPTSVDEAEHDEDSTDKPGRSENS